MLISNPLVQLICWATIASSLTIKRANNEWQSESPVVDLGYARYRGTRLPAGVDQFLGIRYAKAPLGDLRFRAPQEPINEAEEQDASQVRSVVHSHPRQNS